MNIYKTWLKTAPLLAVIALTTSCCLSPIPPSCSDGTVAGYKQACEKVLRSIPAKYITYARNNFHVAYQHTSHGYHVSYGVYGLQDYKDGDSTLFGVSTSGENGKLDFQDNAIAPGEYYSLSEADSNWPNWIVRNETFLDNAANADINVVMWSWCDITNHSVSSYLSSMQTLINEYGEDGTKIGTDIGQRKNPVTFIFMTGHANPSANTGDGNPESQAKLITDYCEEHGYFCLDYYSIDTHDMDGVYHEDADDGDTGGTDFYDTWQASHTLGTDWFENKSSPGENVDLPPHNSQHITANRKAYAFWWILARLSGWGD